MLLWNQCTTEQRNIGSSPIGSAKHNHTHGRQDADDDNHDHQFHEGEGSLFHKLILLKII